MALRQLRLYGDEILRKKAKPVPAITAGTTALLDDMLDTLREKNGLGLAAPQVGILRRIAIVELEENVYELINPVVLEARGAQRRNEACLSVPGKTGDLDRPTYMKIEATNRNGETYVIEGRDLLAAAFSHELDHLDGVLFLDRSNNVRDSRDEEDEDA
jgi:peptide deformylase